jgi:hypothetical protein
MASSSSAAGGAGAGAGAGNANGNISEEEQLAILEQRLTVLESLHKDVLAEINKLDEDLKTTENEPKRTTLEAEIAKLKAGGLTLHNQWKETLTQRDKLYQKNIRKKAEAIARVDAPIGLADPAYWLLANVQTQPAAAGSLQAQPCKTATSCVITGGSRRSTRRQRGRTHPVRNRRRQRKTRQRR